MSEDRILRQLAREIGKQQTPLINNIRKGVIVSYENGTPPTVTVNIAGTNVAGIRHDKSYTPRVDDVVWMFKDGQDYLIGGSLATGTWVPVSYQNGWSDWGDPYQTLGYKLDALGWVNFMGVAAPGTTTTGTVIFNLPAGYRPGAYHQFHPYGSTDHILEVRTNGDVVTINHPGGGAALSITGFRFPIV